MRASIKISLAFLLLTTTGGSAQSDQSELRQRIDDLQSIESMMAAAFTLVDAQEMRTQAERAKKLFFWYENFPQRKQYVECGKAILMVEMFASATLIENKSQSYLLGNRYLEQFRKAMPICERRSSIPPTPKPNLRTFP